MLRQTARCLPDQRRASDVAAPCSFIVTSTVAVLVCARRSEPAVPLCNTVRRIGRSAGRMQNIERRLADYKEVVDRDDIEIDWRATLMRSPDAPVARHPEGRTTAHSNVQQLRSLRRISLCRRDALVEALDEAEAELAEQGENVDADELDAALREEEDYSAAAHDNDNGGDGGSDDGEAGGMFDEANWRPKVWSAARLPRTP